MKMKIFQVQDDDRNLQKYFHDFKSADREAQELVGKRDERSQYDMVKIIQWEVVLNKESFVNLLNVDLRMEKGRVVKEHYNPETWTDF